MRRYSVLIFIATAMLHAAFQTRCFSQVSGTYFGGDGAWGEPAKWTSNPFFPDNGGVATFDCGPTRNFFLFDVDIAPSVTVSKLIVTNSAFQPNLESPFDNTTLTFVGPGEVETNRLRRGTAFLTYLQDVSLNHVAGTNGLTKTGPGVLELGSNNTFTGNVTVRGGFLESGGDDSWAPMSNQLILDGGGFRLVGGAVNSPDGNFARNIVLGANGGTLASGVRSNYGGVISGAGALNVANSIGPRNTVALTANNTYTGATTIRGWTATLSLTGVNGSIRQSSSVTINGGTLDLDNSAAINADRLNDAATLHLDNGTLNVRGNSAVAVAESIGAIHASGNGQIWLRPVNASSPVQLAAAALTRADGGAIRIGNLSGSASISVAQTPTLVGGDGSAVTNRAVIPFAISGSSNSNYTFIGYGEPGAPTTLHPLASNEYAGSLAASSPDSNVDSSSSETVNAPVTINSLRARTLITGSGTLSITSGALLYLNANIFAPIEFGAAQGMVAGQGILPGAISGTNGVVFHNGQFTLTSASTYTGTTAVRNATITLSGDVGNGIPGPFGADTSAVRVSAGSTVQWSTSSPVTMSRSLAFDGTPSEFYNSMQQSFLLAPNAPTLTIAGSLKTDGLLILDAAADGRVDINGAVSGTGMLQAADGSLTVAINSPDNTFSGGILLDRGTFLVGADNALGTGSIQITTNGRILASGGPRTLANQLVTLNHLTFALGPALTFTGGADLNLGESDNSGSRINIPPGGEVTMAGPVIGGTLTLNSDAGYSGTLRLTHDNPQLASPIRVSAGTLQLASPLAVSERGGTLSLNSGVATLDLSNDVAVNRYVLLANSTTQTGTLAINSLAGSNSISTLSIATTTNIAVPSGTLSVIGIGSTTNSQGRLTKLGDGHLQLPKVTLNTLNIQEGFVDVRPREGTTPRLLRINSDLILTGGFATPSVALDLADNDMMILNPNVLTGNIVTAIAQARHGGDWDLPGITSSAARAHPTHATTLGVLTGAQYRIVYGNSTSFHGVPVFVGDTLVKYTYYGDTDFNGVVNFDDYARLDAGFNSGATDWLHGDFDLNGVVNFDDYSLIDLAFNTQSGTLTRALRYLDGGDRSTQDMEAPSLQLVMDHFDQFGIGYAQSVLNAVPEPASLGVVAWAVAVAGLRRRRRRGGGAERGRRWASSAGRADAACARGRAGGRCVAPTRRIRMASRAARWCVQRSPAHRASRRSQVSPTRVDD